MGMCKECGEVFPPQEMENGYCKNCLPKAQKNLENEQTVEESTERIFLKEPWKRGGKIGVPVGFSWTTFLFGFWVPLLRGDITNAIVILLLGDAVIFIGVTLLSSGIRYSSIVAIVVLIGVMVGIRKFWAEKYNDMYLKSLLKKGYLPEDEETKKFLKIKKFWNKKYIKIPEDKKGNFSFEDMSL